MLQGFWFGTIAVLWAGFFMLEGFDFGVGMLLPLVARDDDERKTAIGAIGPVWDGNEVWLLVAGGATFAAFPEWYASAFSGLYLALALVLVGLIIRGIGIEYRGKVITQKARNWCDAMTTVGSFLPALLFGVAFANFMRGLKLDAQHVVRGSFFDLLSPYAILGGLTTLSLFALHGALFLRLRTTGPVREAAAHLGKSAGVLTLVTAPIFLLWTTQIRGGWVSFVLVGVIAATLLVALFEASHDNEGLAFTFSAITTALVPVWVFSVLWPNVLPSRTNEAFSLTVHNASSSHYTLVVMTIVALAVTPIVLAYQAWTYWVFRARVGSPVNYGSLEPLVEKISHRPASSSS
jgi:cytochrome d ubiquinol oxidase subunit II